MHASCLCACADCSLMRLCRVDNHVMQEPDPEPELELEPAPPEVPLIGIDDGGG